MFEHKMESCAKYLAKFLGQAATIQIYAYPNFLLEAVLTFFIVSIHVYLLLEIKKIYNETILIQPHTIHYKKTLRGSYSKESINTSVTHVQHEYCKFDVISGAKTGYTYSKRTKRTTLNNSNSREWMPGQQQQGDFFQPIFEEKPHDRQLSEMCALTPKQYVKLDKERQLRDKRMKGYVHSLTTLFDNIVTKKYSEGKLKEQIDNAKEDTACSRISEQVMKYLESDNVSESLINVLNDIVEDVSSENSYPLKGELTSLVYDIGNLRRKSSMLMDTQCDLVPSSTTVSSMTKTDVSERES